MARECGIFAMPLGARLLELPKEHTQDQAELLAPQSKNMSLDDSDTAVKVAEAVVRACMPGVCWWAAEVQALEHRPLRCFRCMGKGNTASHAHLPPKPSKM
ncbi:jg6927 [Pararge aegeria aegeria]|uniref:Jg6927 protein n=1 Tax=Pararge aegeria aegeria TaxID=348720 RepID=A0A8S4R1I2_9NEOP|nr:jg6927 [Pararge aegeria aegeria]